VRLLALLMATAALFGGEVLERVQRMVPPDRFAGSAAAIRTLFLDEARFYRDGKIDYPRVIRVLEQVGVIPKKGEKRRRFITFIAGEKPYMFLKLAGMALQEGGVYRYRIEEIERAKRLVGRFSYLSSSLFRPSRAVAALEGLGVGVEDIRYEDGWIFVLDLSRAAIAAERIASVKVDRIRGGKWFEVCGVEEVELLNSRSWYPWVSLYDRDLRPLQNLATEGAVRRLRFTLPNGACYIKISDRFTPKNLKYGLEIRIR